jgi:hypothetical protein
LQTRYRPDSLNYWLVIWIHYYRHALSLENDPQLTFVDYEDLVTRPAALLRQLADVTGIEMQPPQPVPFQATRYEEVAANTELLLHADSVYEDLRNRRLR